MRKLSLTLTALILATDAYAATRHSMRERGEAEIAKQVATLVPGEPVHCVPLSRLDGPTIIEGTAIIYQGLGGKLWVNRPRGADMLREDDVLVQEVYGSRLCDLDQIQLLDRATRMQRGFVGLNDFVPYSRPGKTAR